MGESLRQLLVECSSHSEIAQILKQRDPFQLKANEVDQIYRAANRCEANADIKVAFIGNNTLDLFPRYSNAHALRSNLLMDSYVGAYDQYNQELLDPNSGLHAFQADVLFVFLSMRSLSPTIFYSFLSLSESDKEKQANNILAHIDECVRAAKHNTTATICLANFPAPSIFSAETADNTLEVGESEFYSMINHKLSQKYKNDQRVSIFDMAHVINQFGIQRAYDKKMFYLAKMEWSEACVSCISNNIVKYLLAILGRAKKCLVVDLDNTLWGGILGEDGKEGLKIGPGDPLGEAFYDFQHYIISLKQRGVILAICSKNNEADVLSAFEKLEMPISLEDFSAHAINWQPKYEGIQKISKKLNLGLNSLVFIDDSDMECSVTREALPEVEVVQLPKDPADYIDTLSKLNYFEKLYITDEDKQKTKLYKENSKRDEYREDVGDLDSYLKKLETKVCIKIATESELVRLHQLFSKTNQFNLTTKRYSSPELQNFISSSQHVFAYISVEDRFGNLGIVGTYLIEKDAGIARIDSFILSCRAMGRKVETTVMNFVKENIFEMDDINSLSANYLPTEKNIPAEKFYEDQGFEVSSHMPGGGKEYLLKKDGHTIINGPAQLQEH